MKIPVLMYHEIADQCIFNNLRNTLQKTYIIGVDEFREQIEYLSENNYKTLTIEQYHRYLEKKDTELEKSLLITFDDGFKGNYKFAFPILKKHGFTATIFIRVDRVGWNDYLNWNEIKEMQKYGISIQSHSYTHAYLTKIDDSLLKREILYSKKEIEKNTGKEIKYFCYPMGDFNKKVINELKHYGYNAAFSSKYGFSTAPHEKYCIRRIKVGFEHELEKFKRLINPHHPIHIKMALRAYILDSIKIILGSRNYGKLYSKIFNVEI